jgi:hypothetical protein
MSDLELQTAMYEVQQAILLELRRLRVGLGTLVDTDLTLTNQTKVIGDTETS